ncbi:MAG TPA: hypothetical protein VFV72_13230 [Candidatus Limnocylindrales bacterium]|nr:hypothetical protein [Candidatus Limnocylindrales bacterium]
MTASREQRFDAVFGRLRSILEPYAPKMYVTADSEAFYSLDMAPEKEREPATWFGGVRRGKAYVSYYLMSIYADPGLVAEISPALKKRMQGKSCFNFTQVDESLFDELKRLTARGYEATGGDPGWGKRVREESSTARTSR